MAQTGGAAALASNALDAARKTRSGERPSVVAQSPQHPEAAETDSGTGSDAQQSPQAPSEGPARRASTTAATARDLIESQYLTRRNRSPPDAKPSNPSGRACGGPVRISTCFDGCGGNGHHRVFSGGLTNVAVTLTVTDTQTGTPKVYRNLQGIAFAPVQDTGAFGCQ